MKAKYFGVIGNRDYIKIDGERRPFWEFLDTQPDGWLTSLAYHRSDYPEERGPMIWDCGAWSYKHLDVPMLGKNLVTPEWTLEQYQLHAREGDMVVAPDHMLIEGTDLAKRRRFNTISAKRFLQICPPELNPMACIHGMDGKERVAHAERLVDMGYRHLAIGGVAARASQRARVVTMIAAIRDAVPGVYLHVLGLSSPGFLAMWDELGIQSCDGSSHFKQAFTGGAFFVHKEGRMVKHQAGRKDNHHQTDAPHCDCLACSKLRQQGIDTRYYGSNENNMGRAAHNLNKLMEAHQWIRSASSLV